MSSYSLPLPEDLVVIAERFAMRDGTSLDIFLASIIAERIGEMRALAELEARAAKADHKAALAFLQRVPDREPLRGDEIL